jgi:GR25 family glycosyltransferase involved in LPS biosynthesis
MKIHIINLEKSVERRQSILSQAKEYNLNVELFEAFSKEQALVPLKDFCIQKESGFLSKRDIAIYMSHVGLWENLLKESMADFFVIGEDDIKFRNDIESYVIKAMRIKNNWDVCYLHTSKLWEKKFGNDKYKYINSNFYKLDKPHYSNALYIISRYAITKFLKQALPIKDRIDVAIHTAGLRQVSLKSGIFDRCKFNQAI